MNPRLFSAIAIAWSSIAVADAPPQRLFVTVATPNVAVAPLDAGRQFITLPDLEYRFLLEPRCESGWQPHLISLSIADSRQVVAADALDQHGFARTSLIVPAEQLAPLPVSGFCETAANAEAGPATDGHKLKIHAALSAHAALVCISDDAERISYLSRPLGVTFECDNTVAEETL